MIPPRATTADAPPPVYVTLPPVTRIGFPDVVPLPCVYVPAETTSPEPDDATDPDAFVNELLSDQSPPATVTVPWLVNDRLFDSNATDVANEPVFTNGPPRR